MQATDNTPEAVLNLQALLHPFVKQRQEAGHIRRLLASHLSFGLHSVELGTTCTVHQPLALVGSSVDIDAAPHSIKGVHKEYLRQARANVKAKSEFNAASEAAQHESTNDNDSKIEIQSSLEPYLEMVKKQQTHDVLTINQNYIDTISKRPAASVQRFDHNEVLVDIGSLPEIPSEVLKPHENSRENGVVDLATLVDHLEKSVLRAKLLLKREQKLLYKVRAENDMANHTHTSRLQALGTARNELISWIETELSQAGDSAADTDENHLLSDSFRQDHLDSQLSVIGRQYTQYAKSRQSLVTTVSEILTPTMNRTTHVPPEAIKTFEDFSACNYTGEVTLPYLKNLLLVSNQQKALAQQKSNLTINLAKQLKEAGLRLERLAEESHLLPAYPISSKSIVRQGRATGSSFASDLSAYEKPDFARHARAWAHSSASVATSTKAAILDKLESGSASVDETRLALFELRHLLGEVVEESRSGAEMTGHPIIVGKRERVDIWATIEGSLGAIKQDNGDTS